MGYSYAENDIKEVKCCILMRVIFYKRAFGSGE
jgi:hypothetical protein